MVLAFRGLKKSSQPQTPESNVIPDLFSGWKAYNESKFANPPGVEAGTLLQPGSEEPRCWWASIKSVAENDYNLAACRHKPQLAEKAPDDDPAQLIRETLASRADPQVSRRNPVAREQWFYFIYSGTISSRLTRLDQASCMDLDKGAVLAFEGVESILSLMVMGG